ncbi:GNAT family N-acetyltransferase [Sorangium sp. So ce117]|uniref:GNAT family N-acetyltransferase n=1 Tax=Sorangium sp. So ce117 TaxID=3133277 RepID=UPI003F5EC6AE
MTRSIHELDVSLRPLCAGDLDAFMTWASDPEVTRSLFWDSYQDRERARRFLADVAESHPWFMAICLDATPVGAITLDRRSGAASCRAELGYVLARGHWGRGITTRAASLALDRGFADLGVARIEAYVDPDNVASMRVLEKAGMVREGHLRCYLMHRGAVRDRYLYAKCNQSTQ